MGCLFVIVMWAVSAAMIYFFGYPEWVLITLGLLWLASLVFSLISGHTGFGGQGNTDAQIVIAGMFITAGIILPLYSDTKPCNQARTALGKLAAAENGYFAEHKAYIGDLNLLHLKQNPEVQLKVLKADEKSFTASASHNLCLNEKDGKPDIFMWDSAQGGPQ